MVVFSFRSMGYQRVEARPAKTSRAEIRGWLTLKRREVEALLVGQIQGLDAVRTFWGRHGCDFACVTGATPLLEPPLDLRGENS